MMRPTTPPIDPPGTERGYAMLSVVVITAVLLVVGVATLQLSRSELHSTADAVAQQKAFYVADAGFQRGVAQLDQDRGTAIASTTYSYSVTESYAGGSYAASIVQDPLYPSDATKKQISSVGQFGSRQSTTVGHVTLQPSDGCAIVFSDGGTARIATSVPSVATLFNGTIYGNRDAAFVILAGGAIQGNGSVYAVNDLISNSAVSVLSTLNANGFRGGNYTAYGTHADLLGSPALGVHFANGGGNHGVQQTVAARTFPHPDYDRIKRDSRTVIVNADRQPSGTWDSSSGTWVPTTLTAGSAADTIYYVDGNVDVATLNLVHAASMQIVARGWVSVGTVSLLSAGLVNNDVQTLSLVGEKDVYVGRQILSRLPLTINSEAAALADSASGIGLNVAGVASTNNVFAYSETGPVWTKISNVAALNTPRISLVGEGDTTLGFTTAVASTVTCPY